MDKTINIIPTTTYQVLSFRHYVIYIITFNAHNHFKGSLHRFREEKTEVQEFVRHYPAKPVIGGISICIERSDFRPHSQLPRESCPHSPAQSVPFALNPSSLRLTLDASILTTTKWRKGHSDALENNRATLTARDSFLMGLSLPWRNWR